MTNQPESPSENNVPEKPMPSIGETSLIPLKTKSTLLHLLLAALIGLCSAIPVVVVVLGVGAENSGGAVVLFMAFVAVLIQHALSRFAFPANVEKGLPHGASTLFLIGQVFGMYLFFLNTAFYGSTAFVTAALITIPLVGRLVMIWLAEARGIWFYTLVIFVAIAVMFYPFQQETIALPLQDFLAYLEGNSAPESESAGIQVFWFLLASTWITIWHCRFLFRKLPDRKSTAMASAMIAELICLFTFLLLSHKLSFWNL